MTETRHDSPRCSRLRAFTLIELLVVLFIIALLISVLLPSLAAARGQMRGIVCSSNIQQIMLANRYYAEDHNGVYCPGASNVLSNLRRWHGTRDHASRPFESARGPLVAYLGDDGKIRACPQFPSGEIALESGGFERGNGGYGYNNAFIGVQVRRLSSGNYRITNDRAGVVGSRVARPVETVMFTDSAFAARNLIEYSFAEPRFHPRYPQFRADPSIHFRHRNRVNVGWCDGHVDARTRTYTWSSGLYPTKPERFQIGWFGKRDDNSLFDLE